MSLTYSEHVFKKGTKCHKNGPPGLSEIVLYLSLGKAEPRRYVTRFLIISAKVSSAKAKAHMNWEFTVLHCLNKKITCPFQSGQPLADHS